MKISCCDKVLSKITFHIIILASSYAKLHVLNRFVRKRWQNQPPSTINIKSCLLQNCATTKSWTYVHARMLTLITPPSLASATANSWWMSLATIFFKTFLRLLLILPSTVAVAAEDENKQWILIISIMFLCLKLQNNKKYSCCARCGNPVGIHAEWVAGGGILTQGGGVLIKDLGGGVGAVQNLKSNQNSWLILPKFGLEPKVHTPFQTSKINSQL